MSEPILSSLPLLAAFALASAPRAQQSNAHARELFVKNCAACHGETGDGKGTTQLDRPARSFKDGGFSFGNTPEALFRTISVGIPGSPMPGFDSALSEDERKLVAAYVVTLGPPVEEVKEADTIVAVHDRPVVVRGMLPPLAEGLPVHPRGLLIGDPTGITFEYQVDDVRLLALRQGGFVRRTDWSGRGGTPLEPLGKVVYLFEHGKPEAPFESQGRPLTARLSGTRRVAAGTEVRMLDDSTHGGTAEMGWEAAALEYHLLLDGRELAHVWEVPHVQTMSRGTGCQRDFWFEAGSAVEITFRTPDVGSAAVQLARGASKGELWIVARAPGSTPYFVGLESSQSSLKELRPGQLAATLKLDPNVKSNGVSLVMVSLVDWNDDVRSELLRWWEER